MTHLPDRPSAAAPAFCVLALALAAASPAAAQPRVPSTETWYALSGVVPAGTTVVVRTRDGRSTKGRVSSLSDTAIVLEGGRVRSFPAADVIAIEGPNDRSVMRDAGTGAGVGLGLALMLLIGAGPQDSACSTAGRVQQPWDGRLRDRTRPPRRGSRDRRPRRRAGARETHGVLQPRWLCWRCARTDRRAWSARRRGARGVLRPHGAPRCGSGDSCVHEAFLAVTAPRRAPSRSRARPAPTPAAVAMRTVARQVSVAVSGPPSPTTSARAVTGSR